MIEWTFWTNPDSGITDFAFNVNGGSFTLIRSQVNTCQSNGNVITVQMRDFITITTRCNACALRFLANGKDLGSAKYYVNITQLRITQIC